MHKNARNMHETLLLCVQNSSMSHYIEISADTTRKFLKKQE